MSTTTAALKPAGLLLLGLLGLVASVAVFLAVAVGVYAAAYVAAAAFATIFDGARI